MRHDQRTVERDLRTLGRKARSVRPTDAIERKVELLAALLRELIDLTASVNARTA